MLPSTPTRTAVARCAMSLRWCMPSNATDCMARYAPPMAAGSECESTHETPRTRPPLVSTPPPAAARVPAWKTLTRALGAALATAAARPSILRPLGYAAG